MGLKFIQLCHEAKTRLLMESQSEQRIMATFECKANLSSREIESSSNQSNALPRVDRLELLGSARVLVRLSMPFKLADVIIHSAAPDQIPLHMSVEVVDHGHKNRRKIYSFGPVHSNQPLDRGKVYEDPAGQRGPVWNNYYLTPREDAAVLKFIKDPKNGFNNSKYNLLTHSCRTFANTVDSFVRRLK